MIYYNLHYYVYYLEFYGKEDLILLPDLFTCSIIYMYQNGLIDICFYSLFLAETSYWLIYLLMASTPCKQMLEVSFSLLVPVLLRFHITLLPCDLSCCMSSRKIGHLQLSFFVVVVCAWHFFQLFTSLIWNQKSTYFNITCNIVQCTIIPYNIINKPNVKGYSEHKQRKL